MRLRKLIEQHATDVFGSGVKNVLETGDAQVLHIWLDDGSASGGSASSRRIRR
jgi:hypothetical protein